LATTAGVACPQKRKDTPVLKVTDRAVVAEEGQGAKALLDEVVREGARRMLIAALEAERDEYVESLKHFRDERAHALVVKNGYARPREIQLGVGSVEIAAPRVNDRREGEKFTSQILPPYMRRSPQVTEVLPWLYLKGLSTGDFVEALTPLLGAEAAGLSPSSIVRFKQVWGEEYEVWRKRSLAGMRYVYMWADGVHVPVRLEEDDLTLLVMIGVRPDGTKELVAIDDGYRESAEAWAALLRDLKRRGLEAPLLMIGDGNLGLWKALRQVWPETREQRCWVHKLVNVLDKLPKRVQPRAKALLHEIIGAPSRAEAEAASERFAEEFGAKYPKAVASLEEGGEELLTFFDFPAEHWTHLRTTNPIESVFGTTGHRRKKTRGHGSRRAALGMAFKLFESAEKRWRRVNAPHLVELVELGVEFQDGIQLRSTQRRDAA
jgi:transposase-like protein